MHSPKNVPEPPETGEKRFQERIDHLREELEGEYLVFLRTLEEERTAGEARLEEMTLRTLDAVEAEREKIPHDVAEEEKRLRSLAQERVEAILSAYDREKMAERLVEAFWTKITGGSSP